MHFLIEKLYEEMYEPKLLPQDLLNNLTLPNYHSVNFQYDNNILIAITECSLPNGDNASFKYFFKDDKLQEIIQVQPDQNNVIYKRSKEIFELRKKIKQSTRTKKKHVKDNITA